MRQQILLNMFYTFTVKTDCVLSPFFLFLTLFLLDPFAKIKEIILFSRSRSRTRVHWFKAPERKRPTTWTLLLFSLLKQEKVSTNQFISRSNRSKPWCLTPLTTSWCTPAPAPGTKRRTGTWRLFYQLAAVFSTPTSWLLRLIPNFTCRRVK